jgi:hypothetical protein
MQNHLLSQLKFVLIVLLIELALYGTLVILIFRVGPFLFKAAQQWKLVFTIFRRKHIDQVQTISEERKMDESSTLKSRGIVALFEKRELKSFFKTYLYFIFALEVLIFFISFLCQLEPIHITFPWRYYLLASFLTPIVITFLLGVIVKAFNLFCFGLAAPINESSTSPAKEKNENSISAKLDFTLNFFHKVPFLFTLLLLIVGAIAFSQFDHIMALVGVIGEKALVYGLMILGGLTLIATIFAFVWLVFKFKLEKLRYQYEYKRDVMLQLGVLVTEDEKILDHRGQGISLPNSAPRQITQPNSKAQ